MKFPVVTNVAIGFCNVDVVPLPKSQNQDTFEFPNPGCDKSVNCTRNGKQPLSGDPEKLTVGGSYTFMYWVRVSVLEPFAFVTVSEMV